MGAGLSALLIYLHAWAERHLYDLDLNVEEVPKPSSRPRVETRHTPETAPIFRARDASSTPSPSEADGDCGKQFGQRTLPGEEGWFEGKLSAVTHGA